MRRSPNSSSTRKTRRSDFTRRATSIPDVVETVMDHNSSGTEGSTNPSAFPESAESVESDGHSGSDSLLSGRSELFDEDAGSIPDDHSDLEALIDLNSINAVIGFKYTNTNPFLLVVLESKEEQWVAPFSIPGDKSAMVQLFGHQFAEWAQSLKGPKSKKRTLVPDLEGVIKRPRRWVPSNPNVKSVTRTQVPNVK